MLLYIVIFIITMIISMCYRKNKEYFPMTLTCLLVTVVLTLIANCIYFGINYHTFPTVMRVNIDSTVTVDSTKMYENNIVCFHNNGKIYYNDSVIIEISDNDKNYLIEDIEDFKLNDNMKLWFCDYSYPSKSKKYVLKLNAKDYDLYKVYQNYVEKGSGAL